VRRSPQNQYSRGSRSIGGAGVGKIRRLDPPGKCVENAKLRQSEENHGEIHSESIQSRGYACAPAARRMRNHAVESRTESGTDRARSKRLCIIGSWPFVLPVPQPTVHYLPLRLVLRRAGG